MNAKTGFKRKAIDVEKERIIQGKIQSTDDPDSLKLLKKNIPTISNIINKTNAINGYHFTAKCSKDDKRDK